MNSKTGSNQAPDPCPECQHSLAQHDEEGCQVCAANDQFQGATMARACRRPAA